MRENRSDREEVNGRCGRRRWEEKDRGGRGDSRRGGERERGDNLGTKGRGGRGGRSSVEGSNRLRRLRTRGECGRSKMFGSFYTVHKRQNRKTQDSQTR